MSPAWKRRRRREAPEPRRGRPPSPFARVSAAAERDARDADDHEPVLEEVRADDRVLASERRVEPRRPRSRRRSRGVGSSPNAAVRTTCVRLRQEREPDDLGDEHEHGGDAARGRAVVAADDLRQRDGGLAADAPREEETEREEAERPREVEPESGEAVGVHERGERDRRRAARRQRGEPDEPPERVERAVRDEVGGLVPSRPAAPRETDREHADQVERRGRRGSASARVIIVRAAPGNPPRRFAQHGLQHHRADREGALVDVEARRVVGARRAFRARTRRRRSSPARGRGTRTCPRRRACACRSRRSPRREPAARSRSRGRPSPGR